VIAFRIADAQKANQYLPLGLQIAGLFSVGDKSPPSSTGSGGMLSARLRPDRTDKQCVEFTRLNAPCDTVLLDRIPFIASCCLYRSTLERSIVVTDAIVRHGASHPAFALPEITKVCFDKPEALVDISGDQVHVRYACGHSPAVADQRLACLTEIGVRCCEALGSETEDSTHLSVPCSHQPGLTVVPMVYSECGQTQGWQRR